MIDQQIILSQHSDVPRHLLLWGGGGALPIDDLLLTIVTKKKLGPRNHCCQTSSRMATFLTQF